MRIEQLAGNLGALIRGVDIIGDSSHEMAAELRRALLKYKVLFLRDLRLTYNSQCAFAKRFGELTLGHPIYGSSSERPHLREFDSQNGTRANHWHTDLTFLDRPPMFAFLYSVVVPPKGGDTIWANAATAYATLPPELREMADKVRVVHSNDCDYIDDTVDSGRSTYVSQIYETEHAAVQVHPETQERILVLGGFAKRLVGYNVHASRGVLGVLQEFVTRPENCIRWKWQVGDLAIWDNLATQHYAVCDYGPSHRRNERITVAGPVPIGVDGRPSRMIRGGKSGYNSTHTQSDIHQPYGTA